MASSTRGRDLWGDPLLIIYACDVSLPEGSVDHLRRKARGAAEGVQKAGGKPVMWKTGHSLIKEKMRETNAPSPVKCPATCSSPKAGMASTMRCMARRACSVSPMPGGGEADAR